MSSTVKYVELDAHKNTIAVAVAEEGKHGEIANTTAALAKLLAKLAGSDVELNVCYEPAHAGTLSSVKVATAGRELRCGRVIPDPQSLWRPDQD